MDSNILTEAEQVLLDSFLGPPAKAVIKSTNIWIIEWLPSGDRPTGRLLHEWMQNQRLDWSAYFRCASKQEVLSAIELATNLAKRSEMRPTLHLEAHGDEIGLVGPSGSKGEELLEWSELNEPFQRLNMETHCNLVIVVAACIGFAGIEVFAKGPRAPAVALVGPDAKITDHNLLSATKEFYRRWMDNNPNLNEITLSASREAGAVSFQWEPFAVLAFDAMATRLIVSMRQDEQVLYANRIREKMLKETTLSLAEIEYRLSRLLPSCRKKSIQRVWDKMFMIDIYPDNRKRFGVNWGKIVDIVSC